MKVRFNDNLRREAEEYVFRSRVHGCMRYIIPHYSVYDGENTVGYGYLEYRTEEVLTYEFDVVDDPNDDRFFICTYPYKGLVIFKGHVELIHEYTHQGQNDIIEEWSRHVDGDFFNAIPSPVSTSFEEQEKKRAWNAELDRIFDD